MFNLAVAVSLENNVEMVVNTTETNQFQCSAKSFIM